MFWVLSFLCCGLCFYPASQEANVWTYPGFELVTSGRCVSCNIIYKLKFISFIISCVNPTQSILPTFNLVQFCVKQETMEGKNNSLF